MALLRSYDGGVQHTVSKPSEIVPTNFNVETVLEAMTGNTIDSLQRTEACAKIEPILERCCRC